MNAADRRRLTPTLGIAAAVLLLALIALWLGAGRGVHWRDDAAPARLPPLAAASSAPQAVPLERYAEVWQRPVFSPTRTPEPAAAGEGGATGELELTGVILLPGLRMAIIHDKTRNADYRVIEGQSGGEGPALIELHPRSAVVEAGGARQNLQLVPGPAPGSNGPAPPDAGPQAEQPVQPGAGAAEPASAMVTRRDSPEASPSVTGPAAAAVRARQLKARIEADRRRAQRQGGSGG